MKNKKNNTILYGFPSCGKTFFGQLLAQTLNYPFIDTDTLIEDYYKKMFQTPLNCRQIMKLRGEPEFRQIENIVIDELKNTSGSIIAIGGGSLLNKDNQDKLKNLGKLIYLEIDKETLKTRLLKQEVPSYLNSSYIEDSFEIMYKERLSIYEQMHAEKISLKNKSDIEILNNLLTLLA